MMGDSRGKVAVKVIRADGDECRNVEQLLGLRQSEWPTRQRDRLWEALHLVPLVVEGLVAIPEHPDVAAMVMMNLVPLTELAWRLLDIVGPLRVVAQAVEVRWC